VSDKTDHPPVPEAFAALGIRPSILRALAELKFEKPSEIQSLLIPRALAGVDILGQARTGTGKTASFAIPVLQTVAKGLPTQALIMVPTRELCVQVEAEIQRIGQHTPIRTLAVYGGQRIAAQMKFLKHDPEILVGTPGRVIDLLERRIIDFANVRFIVLDEVDRMLDIGFRDDIRNILSRVKSIKQRMGPVSDGPNQSAAVAAESEPQAVPESASPAADAGGRAANPSRVQTIFVSATISEEIEKLARRYMVDPEKLIAPGADEKPTVDKVEQCYYSVQPWDKYRLLRLLLQREQPELAIVFCRTKHGAEKLAHRLHADGIECREIHGNLAQNKRDKVMKNFRTGKFDVLVATDLASRGIDVADISHIVNYDLPDDPEVYVHRVGRTARMGAKGKAYSFVANDQGDLLTKVETLINMVIPHATLEGFTPTPPPADWTTGKPSDLPFTPGAGKPLVNRLDRPYGQSSAPADPNAPASTPALPARPRTIGSKIPVSRRKGRR
jgi:ATP-dependent RNA helicase DeaD